MGGGGGSDFSWFWGGRRGGVIRIMEKRGGLGRREEGMVVVEREDGRLGWRVWVGDDSWLLRDVGGLGWDWMALGWMIFAG